MYVVVLLRGKEKPREWRHSNRIRAFRRAFALKRLHGDCSVFEDPDECKFIVDASEWYR